MHVLDYLLLLILHDLLIPSAATWMRTLLIHPILHISIHEGIHVLRKGSLRLLITYLPAAGSLSNSLREYLLDFGVMKEYVVAARD